MLKNILFDLDGTLLPMNLDNFINYYFGLLGKKMEPYGYEPEVLYKMIWKGIDQIIKNDGSRSNQEVFWDTLKEKYGQKVIDDYPHFESFYKNEFQQAKITCSVNPLARELVKWLKEKDLMVAIATNAYFPDYAIESRIRWANLDVEDFEFYTSYEHYHYCKPSINYYLEIIEKYQLNPEETIMIGNDVEEDMIAEKTGMKVFLLTDCLINKNNKDINQYPHGDYNDLKEYLKECLEVK